jgi:hypothetical protein
VNQGTQRGNSPEEHFISAFVRKDRRNRYLALISRPKGRTRFCKALAHALELNPNRAYPIRADANSPTQIAILLQSLGAPEKCYLISESRKLDSQIMDLRSALETVVGSGIGSIVYCTQSLPTMRQKAQAQGSCSAAFLLDLIIAKIVVERVEINLVPPINRLRKRSQLVRYLAGFHSLIECFGVFEFDKL